MSTQEDELKRIQFYLRRELNKWDRVELDLKNGGVADFIWIDLLLDVLPPVVLALIQQKQLEAQIQMGLNIHAQFRDAMTKQALSAKPTPPARFRTPEEELLLILAPYTLPQLSTPPKKEEK